MEIYCNTSSVVEFKSGSHLEIIIACQAVIIAVFRQSFGNQNDPYEYFQYKVRQAVIG